MRTIEFVTFSLIIDDIVHPDGRTAMGVLGGGGPQTALGMKLWADEVGLVAGVGDDLPVEARDWLKQAGIDTQGLRYSQEWPTLRAWQVLETDGRRIQVWRVSDPAIGWQLARELDKLPPDYWQARGFHLGVHPEEPDLDFIESLRDLGAVVSVEPFRQAERLLTDIEVQRLMSAGQIISPNQQEAESLVGPGRPPDLIRRMVAAGAQVIALRQGSGGALVHRADTGETWDVPAVPTSLVDPTGAGNAFCGGFLVGWVQHADLRLAGLYGAVAASFLVEQVGLPGSAVIQKLRQQAIERLKKLQPQASKITL
ncbi:MAG: PfkB family carbohydrate kinase [Anaerolineae bacterium]|nr:PfkB family carbohydrate kinase [Anaerolineae bacterium]